MQAFGIPGLFPGLFLLSPFLSVSSQNQGRAVHSTQPRFYDYENSSRQKVSKKSTVVCTPVSYVGSSAMILASDGGCLQLQRSKSIKKLCLTAQD